MPRKKLAKFQPKGGRGRRLGHLLGRIVFRITGGPTDPFREYRRMDTMASARDLILATDRFFDGRMSVEEVWQRAFPTGPTKIGVPWKGKMVEFEQVPDDLSEAESLRETANI